MRSTSRWRRCCALAGALTIALASAPAARAQQQAQGFAIERLVQSAPGAGWIAMDDLELKGGLGGAVGLTLGYAHGPLVIDSPGAPSLAVVRHQTSAELAFAVTWDRFRLRASFSSPIYVAGQGGTAAGFHFTAPRANLEQTPDLISDAQVGVDARLLGEPRGAFRLGASAALIAPSGERADYLTDATYRGIARLLVAGDLGSLSYAGHAGVHLRPLDDGGVPGSPRGPELLFGLAAGTAIPIKTNDTNDTKALKLGAEVFGASALQALFGAQTTALEALATARLDGPRTARSIVRFKLGAGAGLNARFGAPQWRVVGGVEFVGRTDDAASPGGW